MTTIEFAGSSRIYIDANIWIYLIEGNPEFVEATEAIFAQIARDGASVVTSEITIAECLWKPSKTGNSAISELYENLFGSGEIELSPLDGTITRRAAVDGGRLGLKLIDGIHYVSAIASGCNYFLTGDRHFKSVAEMEVVHLTA